MVARFFYFHREKIGWEDGALSPSAIGNLASLSSRPFFIALRGEGV